MNFAQHTTQYLVGNGMIDKDANGVLTLMVKHEHTIRMTNRWDEDLSGFGINTVLTFEAEIRHWAAIWVSHNAPEAWYASRFARKPTKAQEKRRMEIWNANLKKYGPNAFNSACR